MEEQYCCYCEKKIVPPLRLTSEHLMPVSRGGNNTKHNRRPCCHRCNHKRGSLEYDVYLSQLEQEYSVCRIDDMKTELRIIIGNVKNLDQYIKLQGDKLLKKGSLHKLSASRKEIVKTGGRKYKIGKPIGHFNDLCKAPPWKGRACLQDHFYNSKPSLDRPGIFSQQNHFMNRKFGQE